MSRNKTKAWNGDALAAVVAGALHAAINDHGPIETPRQVSSATKRVVSQLRGYGFELAEPDADPALKAQLKRLRYGHARLLDQFERVRAQRDAMRREFGDAAEAIIAACQDAKQPLESLASVGLPEGPTP